MNRRMNIEEAVQFVLSPGSDSELSELSDMEDDEVDEMVQFKRQQEQTDGQKFQISCNCFTLVTQKSNQLNKSFFFFSDEPALDNADGNDVQQQD